MRDSTQIALQQINQHVSSVAHAAQHIGRPGPRLRHQQGMTAHGRLRFPSAPTLTPCGLLRGMRLKRVLAGPARASVSVISSFTVCRRFHSSSVAR